VLRITYRQEDRTPEERRSRSKRTEQAATQLENTNGFKYICIKHKIYSADKDEYASSFSIACIVYIVDNFRHNRHRHAKHPTIIQRVNDGFKSIGLRYTDR
jgi:hypothetical protein